MVIFPSFKVTQSILYLCAHKIYIRFGHQQLINILYFGFGRLKLIKLNVSKYNE